jgi:LETM1 and EF-hand domain-containing protein 1
LRETVKKAECFGFSGVRNVGYCFNGSLVGPRFVDGRFRLGDGILVRYASTVAVKRLPPEYDSGDEEGKEMVGKKRKEASADECDQAVEGLSSAKAKAKAKRLNESMKAEKSVLQRTWAALLGLGPALRAVASMSRLKT